MIFDKDFSFLRLRDNLEDAKNLLESPQATIYYNSQIRLSKGETYFQISNSPTAIVFNDSYEVYLVDCSGTEVEDITANVFLEEFFDSNGIKQIAWEYVCNSEYYFKNLSFRFRNTLNNDTWFSNLVNITECDKELTTRFDYKHYDNHYGTQYERANYYQSIRLSTYYRNPINEDTREEYHEITTNNTTAQRNIKKRKRRYVLNDIDNWTAVRIDNMVTCSYLYADFWKMTNTSPIEFAEPEMDSNIGEGEMLLNPSLTYETYTFVYQIFEGIEITRVLPFGINTQANIENEGKCGFNIVPTLNTGTLTLYDASDDSVVSSFTEVDMSISVNDLYLPTLNAASLVNGNYYIQFDSGLISAIGIDFEGISDKTTWAFELGDGEYESTEYDNTQYLTN